MLKSVLQQYLLIFCANRTPIQILIVSRNKTVGGRAGRRAGGWAGGQACVRVGGRGSQLKNFLLGGMDIFWNHMYIKMKVISQLFAYGAVLFFFFQFWLFLNGRWYNSP